MRVIVYGSAQFYAFPSRGLDCLRYHHLLRIVHPLVTMRWHRRRKTSLPPQCERLFLAFQPTLLSNQLAVIVTADSIFANFFLRLMSAARGECVPSMSSCNVQDGRTGPRSSYGLNTPSLTWFQSVYAYGT